MTDTLDPTFVRAFWVSGFHRCKDADWDAQQIEASDPVDGALVAAYHALGEDEDSVRALIDAVNQVWGGTWRPSDVRAMIADAPVRFEDGWKGVARAWLDDHYPNLPEHWLSDLDMIGKEVKRDSEIYVEMATGDLFVFARPA